MNYCHINNNFYYQSSVIEIMLNLSILYHDLEGTLGESLEPVVAVLYILLTQNHHFAIVIME